MEPDLKARLYLGRQIYPLPLNTSFTPGIEGRASFIIVDSPHTFATDYFLKQNVGDEQLRRHVVCAEWPLAGDY